MSGTECKLELRDCYESLNSSFHHDSFIKIFIVFASYLNSFQMVVIC